MAITNGWCRSARLLAVLLTGIALAGGSSAVRRSGGQRAGSASALTPLTELGQSCRTVVIASMLGGVCKADDWRGGLPRFVAQALPQADVFVWNARKKSDVENNICVTCKPLIVPALSNPESRGGVKRQGDHFDCQEMWGKANRTADVLIVVGTGSTFCEYERIHSLPCDAPQDPWENYLSLATVLRQPWLRQDTKTVHIPVRLLQPLNANVMGFDKVIPDNSFVKPLQDTSVNLMKSCGSRPRSNKLMYVARYGSGGKGQLEFLERVDPRLLQGYTVEFYGGNFSHTAAHELQETAQRRGISVLVHPAIPKTDLLLQICLSKGQIHYAYKVSSVPLFPLTVAANPSDPMKSWQAPDVDLLRRMTTHVLRTKVSMPETHCS